MLELFIKRNITPRKLQEMYDGLPAVRDKLEFIAAVLPYVQPRLTSMNVRAEINNLDPEAVDELYKRITGTTEDTDFKEILQLPEPIKQTG